MDSQGTHTRGRGPQPVAVAVHDRERWVGRGMYYDVLGLTALMLSAFALGIDIYRAGYLRALGGASVDASFAPLARLALELAVFIGAFAWVAARLIRAAYHEMPKVAR